jgi:hypothetical protein
MSRGMSGAEGPEMASAGLEALKRTGSLTPSARLVMMLYVLHSDGDEPVRITARELAEFISMTPPVFSRIRKELAADGWLEEDENARFAQIRYYRLGPKLAGTVSQVRPTVIPLRRAVGM